MPLSWRLFQFSYYSDFPGVVPSSLTTTCCLLSQGTLFTTLLNIKVLLFSLYSPSGSDLPCSWLNVILMLTFPTSVYSSMPPIWQTGQWIHCLLNSSTCLSLRCLKLKVPKFLLFNSQLLTPATLDIFSLYPAISTLLILAILFTLVWFITISVPGTLPLLVICLKCCSLHPSSR